MGPSATIRVTTYPAWLTANQRENDAAALNDYLRSLARNEDWRTEFKAAVTNADYLVREAVTALANASGGEVFVGVDNSGNVVGTSVTAEALDGVLRQPSAPREDWYVVDLTTLIDPKTSVPLSGGRRAFVLEVHPPGLPTFVVENVDRLTLALRSSSDTFGVDGKGAISWYRDRRRGEILLGLLEEIRTYVLQIGRQRALPSGLPNPLPLLDSVSRSGEFYRVLTESDREAMVGGGVRGGRRSGAVDTYYKVIDRWNFVTSTRPGTSRNTTIGDLPGYGFEFSNLDDELRQAVQTFRKHVADAGYAVPDESPE
jgi:hypothetical protein